MDIDEEMSKRLSLTSGQKFFGIQDSGRIGMNRRERESERRNKSRKKRMGEWMNEWTNELAINE